MEKLELYRKYRPTSFKDMVGNKDAIISMMGEYKNGAHCFLMAGPSGTGKTSLSRIMATNILKSTQITEINSADNRGIDTAREIIERMRYTSIDGTPLVYIIDEIHNATKQNQEAFLKPMEEPPAHVYFFLATTNPEKLLPTLKSRCSIVNLSPLKNEEMQTLLTRTATAENFEIEQPVFDRIIQLSEGGSRKALKLLAKVAVLQGEEARLNILKAETVLDTNEAVSKFCRLLYKEGTSWSEVAAAIKALAMPAENAPESVRLAVLGYGASILLNRNSEKTLRVMANFSEPTYDNGKFSIIMSAAELYL